MPFKAYIRKMGSSLGIIIPKEEVAAKHFKESDLIVCLIDKYQEGEDDPKHT